MSDETLRILGNMENSLYEKMGTDKLATTKSEMQAYNRGVAEGTKLIRELMRNYYNETLRELGIVIK